MKTELWLDWLRAQRIWADMREYKFHTPESVFLIQHGEIDLAMADWTFLMRSDRRKTNAR